MVGVWVSGAGGGCGWKPRVLFDLFENRLGEGDSPIFLTGHRKIGTVPDDSVSFVIRFRGPTSRGEIGRFCPRGGRVEVSKSRSVSGLGRVGPICGVTEVEGF